MFVGRDIAMGLTGNNIRLTAVPELRFVISLTERGTFVKLMLYMLYCKFV